jgi:hypothetical protein
MNSVLASLAVATALLAAPQVQAATVTVFFTSYNPTVGQCDDSPCIGAAGVDLCQLARDGGRSIALSQELVGRLPSKPFHYGDKVKLTSNGDWRCNGEFVVLDTMNARFRKRGDLFFMDRHDNTSCTATVEKVK